jgi:ABC-2 type transport system permease protein
MFLVVMIAMPLVIMAFLKPAFRGVLVLDGVEGATGAEQVVPGTSVTFALFLVGNLGFAVFREHGWNTWARLRASPATTVDVMVGKSVTPLLSLALQQAVLLGLGSVLFDLHVRGSILALIAVAVAFALSLVGLGYLLLVVCSTVMQLNAVTNLGTMVLAGLGGALAPITALPAWAQAIAPAIPSYWAMRGYRSTILDGGGLGEVALPVVVLLGFAVGFSVVAWARFRVEETKVFFA